MQTIFLIVCFQGFRRQNKLFQALGSRLNGGLLGDCKKKGKRVADDGRQYIPTRSHQAGADPGQKPAVLRNKKSAYKG